MDIGQRNKPPSEDAWQKCIDTIKADRRAFIELVQNAGSALDKVFEYGDGQSFSGKLWYWPTTTAIIRVN